MTPPLSPPAPAAGPIPAPDRRALLRHTALAVGVATAVFLGFVLPAEHGLDPTGLGAATGVARIHSPDPALDPARADPAPLAGTPFREDTTTIPLAPGRGVEFKFLMDASDSLVYRWTTSPPQALFHDLHGEPAAGPPGYFRSYRTGTSADAHGAIVAPFDGAHGWFWENTSPQAVTITLHSAGFYEVKGVLEV